MLERKNSFDDSVYIVPPTSAPRMTGFNPFGYNIHDVINVTCSAPSSDPPSQLEWFINDQAAPETSVQKLSTFTNHTQQSSSVLSFKIDMNHLLDGLPVIKLKCLASLRFNSTSSFGMYIFILLSHSTLSYRDRKVKGFCQTFTFTTFVRIFSRFSLNFTITLYTDLVTKNRGNHDT